MDENKEFIPTLTLDPNAAAATAVSAAPETTLPAEKKPEAPAPEPRKCPYCFSVINDKATRCPHCTSMLEEKK